MDSTTLNLYFTDKDAFRAELNMAIKKCKYNNEISDLINNLTHSLYELHFKHGVKGHVYCLYNEVYEHYGSNVYKLGKSQDVNQRLKSYTTSYIEPSVIEHESVELANYVLAENILFSILGKYRVKPNREFFDCHLDKIKHTISKIEKMFSGGTDIHFVGKILIDIRRELEQMINVNMITTYNKKSNYAYKNDICSKIKFYKLITSDDISESEYNKLSKCPETTDDAHRCEKYYYKQVLSVDEIKKEHFRKLHVFNNMNVLFNGGQFFEIESYDTYYNDYIMSVDNRQKQLKVVKHIIGYFNVDLKCLPPNKFTTKDVNKYHAFLISKDSFLEYIEKMDYIFKNRQILINCFKINTKQLNNYNNKKNIKKFLGIVNSILKHYGLTIALKKNNYRSKDDNKVKTTYSYYFTYIK